jgi:cell filamentation protein
MPKAKGVFVDSVEPALVPGTNTFENLLGIVESSELRVKESDLTFIRSLELLQNPSIVAGTFDFYHLKNIHKYIFQDLYSWAGKPRSYDMAKNGDVFTPADEMPFYEKEVFERSKSLFKNPPSLHSDITIKLARCLGVINLYHPFPEGNGRAQRIFISFLALSLNQQIDWKAAKAWEMIETFKRVHVGDYEPLEALMHRITSPKV